jgi:hypothetical protein
VRPLCLPLSLYISLPLALLTPTLSVESVTDGYLTIAALQGLHLPLLVDRSPPSSFLQLADPCLLATQVSLLLDVDMLKMLREMLVLAHLIREQLVARRLVAPLESTYVPQSIRSLQEAVHRMIVTWKQQPEGSGVLASISAIAAGAESMFLSPFPSYLTTCSIFRGNHCASS